jgi:LL-diaminopimelate aminotransferase
MRHSRRLDGMPEYLTARLNRVVAERRAAGRDVISLGVGDPDLPPSQAARDTLAALVRESDAAHYPTNRGTSLVRGAVARFYQRRFGVTIDPETQVLPLLGAKEGIAHLALAQLDAGDAALVADPGYPVYVGGPTLAGADVVALPLDAQRGFTPDLDRLSTRDRGRANLLIVGYPNNPTGAVIEDDFFERLVAFAAADAIPVCHDNAYSELGFDGYTAPSFLATAGAVDVGVEILSLSKAFSLPGWRVAFAVGNAAMIASLYRLKTQIDAGMFVALQQAAAALLDAGVPRVAAVYQERRDVVCDRLGRGGVATPRPKAGMYIWLPVPTGEPSVTFAERLLDRGDVVVAPGVAFGASGEGFVRLALTQPVARLEEACERILACL